MPKESPDPSAKPSAQEVFTLVVELGRTPGDGLPEGATGGAMICYAAGRDEAEAVRETVKVLREAGLNPLNVTGHGTEAERRAEGHEIDVEETNLLRRAHDENAVIVAQATPYFGDDA